MKKIHFITAIMLIAFAGFLFSAYKFKGKVDVKGWFLAGNSPASYEIGVENNAERGGKVAYLKSIKQSTGFGTIMQVFVPKDYLGKRVKLTGFIKSNNVTDWAGMWFRVDGDKGKVIGFDNMQSRPVKGTTAWRKYETVLDVPNNSLNISYGVLLAGEGNVWLDDLTFTIVGKSVPVTVLGTKPEPTKPTNNNFESSGK
ncbi:MAG: hypothetical protein V5804_00365 [Mucilaginibacter sp.]|uniref:hypothetical protein n=1 Tax=Mucilaginibacter sp. TaxID=1882438 RepID=UPI0034E48CD4